MRRNTQVRFSHYRVLTYYLQMTDSFLSGPAGSFLKHTAHQTEVSLPQRPLCFVPFRGISLFAVLLLTYIQIRLPVFVCVCVCTFNREVTHVLSLALCVLSLTHVGI